MIRNLLSVSCLLLFISISFLVPFQVQALDGDFETVHPWYPVPRTIKFRSDEGYVAKIRKGHFDELDCLDYIDNSGKVQYRAVIVEHDRGTFLEIYDNNGKFFGSIMEVHLENSKWPGYYIFGKDRGLVSALESDSSSGKYFILENRLREPIATVNREWYRVSKYIPNEWKVESLGYEEVHSPILLMFAVARLDMNTSHFMWGWIDGIIN